MVAPFMAAWLAEEGRHIIFIVVMIIVLFA